MNILLSYFFRDFGPSEARPDPMRADDTDAVFLRAIFGALSERGTVTCTDAAKPEQVEGSYDLYVGVLDGFNEIAERIDCPRKMLFAWSAYPSTLKQQATAAQKAIQRADAILCVGNNQTLNSYLEQGVPFAKIRMVNCGVGEAREQSKIWNAGFLYRAPRLGVSSGLDIIAEIALSQADEPRFRLEIVGTPEDEAARKRLSQIEKSLGERCTIHDWISCDAPEYLELIERANFLLAPVSEGPSPNVLHAIRNGVVPLVSVDAGIDFAPFGFLEPKVNSESNQVALRRAIEVNDAEWKSLSDRTLEYYRNYHRDIEMRFGMALDALIAGNALPKLSLILPIFNKERTIKGLLRLMHRTCETYGNCEAIIIFDGCKDKTETIVRKYLASKKPKYPVTYRTTPNVFEVKSNNLGLELATGKYGVIMQDDTYLYDRWCLHEAASYLEKNPRCAVLGGLAGVNFYPLGTRGLEGRGQILMGEHETYWRQDTDTDPELANRIFRTDACMRGPLILRKSFLETHGYLDEAYVPLYNDDMDLCMRAASKGFTVQTMMMDTENKNLTQAHYNPERRAFFDRIIRKNTETFYTRWTFSTDKSQYEWINRVPLRRAPTLVDALWRAYYVQVMSFFSSVRSLFMKILRRVGRVLKFR